ncbi:glycine dehydrogenase [candidate division TA06 bacterium DG_26]|uniref:Probable glycine dehydrogenase (decarboxylating) subunit 1 n=1 Tax=candidate division TA06 bacterium DG_26 TaxID=1703771 RepID=A0A0S7WKY8_UNCT6|nr:MAG: glycine dehydrogenase [candidate division TA06 bacterium DG_26]
MRFIPHTPEDKEAMLQRIGVHFFEELIQSIPESSRLKTPLGLPKRLSELETRDLISELGQKNERYICFAGGGAYDHFIPSVVDSILARPEFYTAYTPYQAEVSQGTLQTIYEYQSMICELTGMQVSNASMYDGGSALAEAAHMARTITKRDEVVVSNLINPWYERVLETYCRGLGLTIHTVSSQGGRTDLEELQRMATESTACVIAQHPNFLGCLEERETISGISHERGALFVVCVDPISLGLLKPPGEYGADIVVGEGQCLGLPMSLGGPFLGVFATRQEYIRSLPGRLVAATQDSSGRRGFVLTMQTREQHIRRERATSNICTNQALCALAACVYLALLGKEGIREVAELCLQKSHYLAERLCELDGWRLPFAAPFFKEFCIQPSLAPEELVNRLRKKGILAGIPLGTYRKDWEKYLLVSVTEKRKKAEMDDFVDAVR